MWVKICANTSLEDTLLAAELGADAVGFVFAESKRRVSPEQVAAITPHLPSSVEKVGVFSHHSAAEIAAIVQIAGLDTAQLHNGYDPALVAELEHLLGRDFGLIQTLHWRISPISYPSSSDGTGSEAPSSSRVVTTQLDAIVHSGSKNRVLVDSSVGKQSGGTGVSFDWNDAAQVFADFSDHLRLIAAGGMTPETVLAAIKLMRPWGIDVASGVESSPGRKDPLKLADFLKLAKSTL